MKRAMVPLWVVTFIAAACRPASPPEPALPVATSTTLGQLRRDVHLSFRADGRDWVAEDGTHQIRVSATGLASVTAFEGRAEATAQVQTRAIARGGKELPLASPALVHRPDGSVAVERGAATETWSNHASGAEQAWTFAAAPRGRGDLEVRVELRGMAFRGASRSGLHFFDPQTRLGFAYQHAVWIDASGDRNPVEAKWEHGQIALRVPEAVVRGSRYPAVLDPTLTAENAIDQPILGPAPGIQKTPAIATDGTNDLAVWDDERRFSDDLYAVVLNHGCGLGGCSPQLPSFPIATNIDSNFPAAVAANGSDFLVAYTIFGTSTDDVYAKRVTQVTGSSQVIDVQPIAVSALSGSNEEAPSVASDNNGHYAITWQDDRNTDWNIYGAVLSSNDAGWVATGLQLTSEGHSQVTPTVGFNGSNFIVAWEDDRGTAAQIYWTLMDATGAGFTLDGAPASSPATGTAQTAPAVPAQSASGQSFIAWQEARSGGTNIYGGRVTSSFLDGSGFPLNTSSASNLTEPAVGYDGTYYVVAWNFHDPADPTNGIYATCVDTTATSFCSPIRVATDAGSLLSHPGVASYRSDSLLVWGEDPNTVPTADISVARMDRNAITSTPYLADIYTPPTSIVDISPNRESFVSAAFDGTQYLAVWADSRSGQTDNIVGAFLDPNGVAKTPVFAISPSPYVEEVPAVAYGAGQYLVAWSDSRATAGSRYELRAARVLPDASVLDPAGLVVSNTAVNGARTGQVGFDGQRFLVVSDDLFPSAIGAFVDSQGTVTPPNGFLLGPDAGQEPRLAFDGTNYLVTMFRGDFFATSQIFGIQVRPDGGLVQPDGFPIGLAGSNQLAPTVAFDGNRSLVVWADLGGLAGGRISGRFVNPDGTVGVATLDLLPPDAGAVYPDIIFDGNHYVLSWLGLSGTGPGMHLTWLTDGGQIAAPDQVAAPDFSLNLNVLFIAGQLATDGQGKVLVPYAANSAPLNIDRAVDRVAVFGDPLGTSCSAAGACASGFCVDGVCCDSACGGGSPTDCQQCNSAGHCAAAAALPAITCRTSSGECDHASVCDGVNMTCPVDTFAPDGTVCQSGAGVCSGGVCKPPGVLGAGRSYYSWGCGGCGAAGGGAGTAWVLATLVALTALRRGRRRQLGKASLLLAALWAVSAGAAEDKKMRLMFINITASTGVTPKAAQSVSELAQTELVGFGAYEVLGQSEIVTLLGIQRQKQILGCADEASGNCLAELAGALNAERAVTGDVARFGDELVLNLTLLDVRNNRPIYRVDRRVKSSSDAFEPLLDEVRPALYELVSADARRTGPSIHYERGFGGLMVGARAEGDIAGPAVTPSVFAEYSGKSFGASVAAIIKPRVGARLEGRWYPLRLGRLRPYVALGGTAFLPVVAGRAALGADFAVGNLHLIADAAFEHFFNPEPGYLANALLFSVGAGWLF